MKNSEKALAFLIGMGIAVIVILALNFIPWLLWNKLLSPLFGWRHFSFWQIFFLILSIRLASTLVFGYKGKTK